MGKRSAKSRNAVNVTNSGTSCNSTPASSNRTLNCMKTELTSAPEPDDLDEEMKVRKIMAEERVEECGAAAKANGSVMKRARLLSERGEHEMLFPVIDPEISVDNWHGCGHLRNKHGVGLFNQLNDCFLNSVLQAVVHTSHLARFLIEKRDQNCCERKRRKCFTCKLAEHVLMSISAQKVQQVTWMNRFWKEIFPSHARKTQEDAHEMLTLLLGELDKACPAVPEEDGAVKIQPTSSSPIDQIFGGSLRNQRRCNACGTDHISYDRIREFNLGLNRPAGTSVTELFDDFFRQEQLEEYYCTKCKRKQTATRSTWILRLPLNLIIQIKRFVNSGQKNALSVKADVSLNLNKYLFNEEFLSGQYTLNGIIEHRGGTLKSGHYVSSWRGFDERTFFHFNDFEVRQVSFDELDQMQPYLLFYSKKSSVSEGAESCIREYFNESVIVRSISNCAPKRKSRNAANATNSGTLCNSNSTPASSNRTINSIKTELTSAPEPDDLDEEMKVRKIMAEERVEEFGAAAEANGSVMKRARLLSKRGELVHDQKQQFRDKLPPNEIFHQVLQFTTSKFSTKLYEVNRKFLTAQKFVKKVQMSARTKGILKESGPIEALRELKNCVLHRDLCESILRELVKLMTLDQLFSLHRHSRTEEYALPIIRDAIENMIRNAVERMIRDS